MITNPSKRQKHSGILLLAIALACPTFAGDSSGPPPGAQPDQSQMMSMMEAMAKPGENHKLLSGMVGSWKYTVKMWFNPDPNAPPSEYTGKATTKAIMDGRYFQSDYSGMMEMPAPDGKVVKMEFKGMGIDGYDNAKKKFVSSWVDNMGTGIVLSEGSYDPAAKTLTYTYEVEMMPGMKMKERQVVTLIDKDHHTVQFFENRNGTEVKTMEIDSVRK